jgi:hypothetical protein
MTRLEAAHRNDCGEKRNSEPQSSNRSAMCRCCVWKQSFDLAAVGSKRRASVVFQGISLAKGEDGDKEYPRPYNRERKRGTQRLRESQISPAGAQSTGNTCTFRNL